MLAQGAHAHRISPNLPIYLTEFGFQTNPPDRTFGVSLARQAEWINQSDYIAYRDSRVKSVSQYELFDEPDLSVFQTGLRFVDGSAKPSLDAYRLPIWVTRHGSGVSVWGQVRPADGSAAAGHDPERQQAVQGREDRHDGGQRLLHREPAAAGGAEVAALAGTASRAGSRGSAVS